MSNEATIAKQEATKIREVAEINEAYLLGLMWSNPSEYYSSYKDRISSEKFLHKVWGFFFDLGKKLYEEGAKTYDDVTVYSKVKDLGLSDVFEEYGTKKTIDEAVMIVKGNEVNIEYYYESLEKNHTVIKLVELFGNKVLVNKGKYDYNKMNRTQLMLYWTDRLTRISVDSINNYETENLYVSAEEFINKTKENSANMLKFYDSRLMNSITQGVPRGQLTMFGGFGNSGKSLDIDSNIPTENGWVKAKDVKVGSKLFDRLGNPTTVLGVFPHGVLKSYEVTLDDGRTFVVNDEHIIPYVTSRGNIANKTLGEMMKDYIKYYKIKDKYEVYHTYKIPNTLGVEYLEKEYLISPYALGILLGDGCLSKNTLEVSNSEKDVVEKISKELGLNTPEKSKHNYTWLFSQKNNPNSKTTIKEYKDEIARLEQNKTALNKFIPDEYMLGSKEQRMSLLKGLMDTDGTVRVSKTGAVAYAFSTNSEQLAKDVKLLAHSLGIGATMSGYNREEKENSEYEVRLYTSKTIVSSEKHLEKLKDAKKFSKKEKYSYIVDIKEVESREMVCFKVDNDESLFLMGDYVVTHNTSIMAEKFVMACVTEREKTLVLLNEEDAHSFRQKILLSILNHEFNTRIDRKKLTNGALTDKDEETIHRAFEKMKELMDGDEALIKVVYMEKYVMDDLENIVKLWANRGYNNLFIDTHKVTDEYKNDKRWEAFVEDTKRIHRLTRENAGGLNLRTVLTFQLADAHLHDKFLGFDAIGEGKAAKNEAAIVMMYRPIFGDEYDKLHVYRNRNKGTEAQPHFEKEKVELDKTKTYYLLFAPKNRYGANTDNGQPILVLKPEFDFNAFKEVGWTQIARSYN
jgi:replicative DNA helicase